VLLDAGQRLIAGRSPPAANDLRRPIVVGGSTVGWVALAEASLEPADRRFLREQLAASWTIAGLAVLLAAVAAMLLARGLLAPIRRLARATHRLATGNYGERVVATTRDELGQLVGDFNALAGKLDAAQRQRREFLADISHELRTPLAILQGELEALQDGVRTLSRDAVASLQVEVAALNRLVDDLYALAQADLDGLGYDMKPVALDELSLAAVRAFRDRAHAAGLRLEVPGALPQTIVRGDRQRLTQVLNNVLENCIRYTDSGGSLRVGMHEDAGAVHIDVEDSKPGVTEAELPRLFERLYRVERSRNRGHGGSGLGLSLAKAVVERHGGSMKAQPSPLGGLWIRISLPLAK
jgi:two-component system sensor histidine kinase BaeS